eukprot:TRINITY_DN3099_c2_g1_i1.p1 TRINITY_DN3099_c2_g1~~TRINITY_DN3099_c2_g1_i1.p1  ORF type:complete len:520 (+),score=57.78 TRINITY_DN3099_c2_g1_i1:54-1613(+)
MDRRIPSVLVPHQPNAPPPRRVDGADNVRKKFDMSGPSHAGRVIKPVSGNSLAGIPMMCVNSDGGKIHSQKASPLQSKTLTSTASGGVTSAASGGRISGAASVSAPMSAAAALTKYDAILSSYERTEILEYKNIYYTGSPSKIYAPTREGANHGYDDERGDYTIVPKDHLIYRYEIMSGLGRGSFGQVVKCLDHKTGRMVAIKIVRNKRKFHKQALIEIRLLQHLRKHDKEQQNYIVCLHDYFMFRDHICMIFDLHSINIYEFIKLNKFQPLNLNLVRRFAAQLLKALAYLFRQNIIHCDLKPENIILKQAHRATIRLIDFGSSCFETERLYTYMQSRFYRAPEVILGIPYTKAIDMWSLGCTLAELATGYPLFPGETEGDQLLCIMEIMGLPPQRMLQTSPRRRQFFDHSGQPKIIPNSRGKRRRPNEKRLRDVLRASDPQFVDFIKRCLAWQPELRMTPEEALQHPFMKEIRTSTSGTFSDMQPAPPATSAPSQRSRNPESYLPSINGKHTTGVYKG